LFKSAIKLKSASGEKSSTEQILLFFKIVILFSLSKRFMYGLSEANVAWNRRK
jgi:hypothetical protein